MVLLFKKSKVFKRRENRSDRGIWEAIRNYRFNILRIPRNEFQEKYESLNAKAWYLEEDKVKEKDGGRILELKRTREEMKEREKIKKDIDFSKEREEFDRIQERQENEENDAERNRGWPAFLR